MTRLAFRKVGSDLKPIDIITADYMMKMDPGETLFVEKRERKRSLEQNNHFHALYAQIAQQWDGMTQKDVTRHCKLHYGIPILRRDDEDFRNVYDKSLKKLEYVEKLQAMDYMSVTRLFSTKQGVEYIDEINREFTEQGFLLVPPEAA